MFGQISGRISQLSRASCVRTYTERKIPARRMPSPRRQGHLRCRKPCVGRRCFIFLPGLLDSPMHIARGMTALTQLLHDEGHCRRLPLFVAFRRFPPFRKVKILFPRKKKSRPVFPPSRAFRIPLPLPFFVFRFRQIPNPGR